jgi:hypothetical protein
MTGGRMRCRNQGLLGAECRTIEPARDEQDDPAGAVGLLRLPVTAMEPADGRRDGLGDTLGGYPVVIELQWSPPITGGITGSRDTISLAA